MNLYLAPLQGLTVSFYRNLYHQYFGGIDTYYAPFIATTHMRKTKSTIFKDLYAENNNPEIKVIPQLLGNDGEDFRFYAQAITKLGYDEVNWNIGCPYPTVTKKKKGSGLLPHPDLIETFLDEACKDSSYKVSVKMRLGLHDVEEGMKVMELLNKYPLKNVILHGRTGDQRYGGTVNLDAFDVLYKECKHPLIYNGDIFTYEDYQRIQERFPHIDSFMLGRGALRDPFLPSIIKNGGETQDNELEKIKCLHDEVFKYYEDYLSGETHLCDRMKEFWIYLSDHLDPSGKMFKKIKKAKNKNAYLSVVNQIFANTTSWR